MRPYFVSDSLHIRFAHWARRTLFRFHTSGTWVYASHIVNNRIRLSRYLLSAAWNTSSAIIFRCRRGNGYGGSIKGELYQDQYAYIVPTSINNTQGQASRDAFAQAIFNWQSVLTDTEKQSYYDRCMRLGLSMSGYNLYISDYVREHA